MLKCFLWLLFLVVVVGCKKSAPITPKPVPVVSDWKAGPMPYGTWNWGGVVPKDDLESGGFYFADFRGDHVLLCPGGKKVEAKDIAWYNNALDLPPTPKKASASRLQ